MFYKGSWREVCGTNWDIKDATVVCRQLGFQGAVAAATSASDSSFMYSVQCDGNKASLMECDLTPKTWCRPNRAACVVCIPGNLTVRTKRICALFDICFSLVQKQQSRAVTNLFGLFAKF